MTRAIFRMAGIVPVALLSMAAMSPSGPAPKTPDMAALRSLEKGQWELRERGTEAKSNPARRICVGDPAQLLHVKHERSNCRRFVVSDDKQHAVVTYECSGEGSGRTDLRVETPRLVQIDAQGISQGAPFSMTLEGRRTGDCQ